MKANVYCGHCALRCLTVFLNGKKVDDAIEADEEAGYVWADYRGVDGKLVPYFRAESGALIQDDIQVIKLTGQVRIEVIGDECCTAEDIQEECERLFVPISPKVLDRSSSLQPEHT